MKAFAFHFISFTPYFQCDPFLSGDSFVQVMPTKCDDHTYYYCVTALSDCFYTATLLCESKLIKEKLDIQSFLIPRPFLGVASEKRY